MRKTFLIAAVSALSLSIALPANAAQGSALEQRVKRLERMLENPVLLQLSRRLGEQQRDIQTLQDENDRLKRDLNKLRALMDKRYKESDERFSLLEGGKTNTGSTTKNLYLTNVSAPACSVAHLVHLLTSRAYHW